MSEKAEGIRYATCAGGKGGDGERGVSVVSCRSTSGENARLGTRVRPVREADGGGRK